MGKNTGLNVPLILCKCGMIKGWCEIHKYTKPYKPRLYMPNIINKSKKETNDIHTQSD